MTLGPYPDPVGPVDQVVLHFFPAQAEEVGMSVGAEWAWASWGARQDQGADNLDGGCRLDLRPTLAPTTS